MEYIHGVLFLRFIICSKINKAEYLVPFDLIIDFNPLITLEGYFTEHHLFNILNNCLKV